MPLSLSLFCYIFFLVFLRIRKLLFILCQHTVGMPSSSRHCTAVVFVLSFCVVLLSLSSFLNEYSESAFHLNLLVLTMQKRHHPEFIHSTTEFSTNSTELAQHFSMSIFAHKQNRKNPNTYQKKNNSE